MTRASDQDLLLDAVGGDARALRSLVDRLTPVIQARVARVALQRMGAGPSRDLRQDVRDLTQEVFLFLLEEDARKLRAWDPGRGLSLENFVGLLAGRQASAVLQRRRGNPAPRESLPRAGTVDEGGGPGGPDGRSTAPDEVERRVSSRELAELVLDRLALELTPMGRRMFDLLVVQDLEVAEICRVTSLKPNAVHVWRNRLTTLARRVRGEILSGS